MSQVSIFQMDLIFEVKKYFLKKCLTSSTSDINTLPPAIMEK